ncbi:MAG: PQQ-binding-like beta-propeller repeat protein, partial [Phycisphaerae bacterium]
RSRVRTSMLDFSLRKARRHEGTKARRQSRALRAYMPSCLRASSWAGAAAATIATAAAQTNAPSPRDSWPMFRGDLQNRGVANTKLADKLELKWKFATTPDESIESTAAIVDGVAYVGATDGHLYAINLKDGMLRWKFRSGEPIKSSPTIVAGLAIFGDELGTLHGVAIADGKSRWAFKAGAEIVSSAIPVDGKLIFGDYYGGLHCVRQSDGSAVWKYETEDKLHGTPGVFGEHVLVAGCDAKLHVVRVADGKADRTIPLGSVCGASAAGDERGIVLGTYGNQVLGIDWKNAKLLWEFEDADRQFPFVASAAIRDDLAIVGGRDKRLRAFDRMTGDVRWTFTTKGRLDGSAVIVGERVVIGAMDGVLHMLDLRDGRETWRYEVGSPLIASPAIAEGVLVIGAADGVVYCFGERQ